MSTRRTSPTRLASTGPDGGHAPTIVDLAAVVGVSKATVSRVLNGSPRVAEDTRIKVLSAIGDLGFQVNYAARSLRTSRTGLVGILVPVISVFGRILEELDRELADIGVSMLLTASRRRQPEGDIGSIETLVGRGVDALVLAPSDETDPRLAETLERVRTPILLLDRQVRGVVADALHVDQGPGLSGAMEYLKANGRTRIGLLTRDDRTRPGREIVSTYRQNLERFGWSIDTNLVREFDDLDRRTARDGVDGLLAAGADAVISTGTMEHTSIVLERLSEVGVSIPGDLGLVVYGYMGGSMITGSGLPTVAYPVDRIAHATFRLLQPRLSGSSAPGRIEVVPNVFQPPPPTF